MHKNIPLTSAYADVHLASPSTLATSALARSPQEVVASISKIPGMDAWKNTKLHQVQTPHDAETYKAQFNRNKSRITMLFHCCSTRHMLTGLEYDTEHNIGLIETISTINTLVDNNYKIIGVLSLQPRNEIVKFDHVSRYVSATKMGVGFGLKIQFRFRVASRSFSMKPIITYSLGVKDRGAKHYRAALPPSRDLQSVLEAAEREIKKRESNDLSMLPKPCAFIDENYKIDYFWVDGKKMQRVARTNSLRTAIVVGIASLHSDETFTLNVQDPKNKNVWFIIMAVSYEGYQHKLAVNDNGWYKLAGKKYLHIALDPRVKLQLVTGDKKLIRQAINNWLKSSI